MTGNYEHIATLIQKHNNGVLAIEEERQLKKWIEEDQGNRSLFDELTDPDRIKTHLFEIEKFDKSGGWEKIKTEIGLPEAPVKRIFPFKKIAVAASILILLAAASYFAFFNKKSHQDKIAKQEQATDVEAPKTVKASIKLADGKVIALDSLTTLSQNDVQLTRTADGKLIYSGKSTEVAYNTLTNPRGSKAIDITLADGSQVWLNAESSITYPVSFIGDSRKVSMTGEAYFEVAHNSEMPFMVTKGDVAIQVLGTKFNVNAYNDENAIKVTLLEGSVKTSKGNLSNVIKPGQQAKVADDIKIINGVDLEEVMAWKNGNFKYTRTDLKIIMREIGRWYDVDIVYEGNIPEQLYNVGVPRTVNVSEVLKGLEYTGAHFSVEGKKIIVRP